MSENVNNSGQKPQLVTDQPIHLFVHARPLGAAHKERLLKQAEAATGELNVRNTCGYPRTDMQVFERVLSFQNHPRSYITNQESILLRALRLVREGRLLADQLRVWFYNWEDECWDDNPVTDDGDLDHPTEFTSEMFDWRADELF